MSDQHLNPQPPFWPQCDTCGLPYVLRRSLSFTTNGYLWAWMRDCTKPRSTCKNAKPVIVGPNGSPGAEELAFWQPEPRSRVADAAERDT